MVQHGTWIVCEANWTRSGTGKHGDLLGLCATVFMAKTLTN